MLGKKGCLWRHGILIACFTGLLFATVQKMNAQQTPSKEEKVTLQFASITSKDLIKEIDRQSAFTFLFDEAAIKATITNIHFNAVPLKQVLLELKNKAGLEFEINGSYISVTKSATPLPKKIQEKSGILKGRVRNEKSGDVMIGATVSAASKSVISDNDGGFMLTLPAGKHRVSISAIGYENAGFFVQVNADDTSFLDVPLQQEALSLQGVVVEARKRTNTEATVLNNRKNAATVQDAISAEMMQRTASITSAQALQRVQGVSVRDGKYVAVRGMTDRNIVAQLNGARLSSANSDRSAIPLDLIPTSLLDNIVVEKSVTADRPADAVAGLVEIKTKSIPDTLMLQIEAQVGANDNIGFGGQIASFHNADPGFFGQRIADHNLSSEFLDLGKKYGQGSTASGIADMRQLIATARNNNAQYAEAMRLDRIMKSFDPYITATTRTVPLNQQYGITFGNKARLFGKQLGYVAALSYYRVFNNTQAENNRYGYNPNLVTPNNLRLVNPFPLTETRGTDQVYIGALATITYQFNKNHEVSVTYLGNRGAEAETIALYGTTNDPKATGIPYKGIANWQYFLHNTSRWFHTLQLRGTHKLQKSEKGIKINWSYSQSRATQDEPDYRQISFVTDSSTNPPGYTLYVQTIDPSSGAIMNSDERVGRFYRKLKENNKNATIDLQIPLVRNSRFSWSIKTGAYYLRKERDFSEIFLSLPDQNEMSQPWINGDLTKLVSLENVGVLPVTSGSANGGLLATRHLYHPGDLSQYSGYFSATAFYALTEINPVPKLKIVGGLRFENTRMKATVDSTYYTNSAYKYIGDRDTVFGFKNNQEFKPFASATAIYALNNKMNLRFAFGETMSRPELRELIGRSVKALYGTDTFHTLVGLRLYDPVEQATSFGNDKLVNSRSRNYELRWEWFPAREDVFSFGVFYKEIDDQLEKVFANVPFAGSMLSFRNNPNKGKVYGMEIELRKSFGDHRSRLGNFYAGMNMMLAYSVTTYSDVELKTIRISDPYASDKRPLYEQPPYIINANIGYNNSRIKTVANLVFNVTGERLIQIYLSGTPNVYERPSPTLDFTFAKGLYKRWQVKGYIKNILNSYYSSVYTLPNNNGKYGSHDETYYRRRYQPGREIAVGVTYNLF